MLQIRQIPAWRPLTSVTLEALRTYAFRPWTLAMVVVCLFGGDWLGAEASGHEPNPREPLKKLEVRDVQPLWVSGSVYLAGQPNEEVLRRLKESGVKAVVNFRPDAEMIWSESKLVQSLGMKYHHLPFRAPETLTPDLIEKARRLLNDPEQQLLLMHCSSANRVGAIWLAHRVLDDGIPYDQALREAKKIGLRTPEYEEQVRVYLIDKGQPLTAVE